MSLDQKIDWAVVEAAVQRGVREFSRAYFIPANRLCGDVAEYQDRLADNWGQAAAPYVTACIREDLRKVAARACPGEVGSGG